MRTKLIGASLAFACLVGQASVGAAEEAPLQPTGKWMLDYGDTQCVALRDYGNEANPITLAIRSAPSGETYEILVGRKRYGPEFAEEFEGSVDFGWGQIKSWLLHHGGKKRKLTIDRFRITSAEMAQARTSKAVTLRSKGSADVTFSLANMSALLKGLEDCTADLKRYWNDGGAEDGRIAVPPKGDVRKVFTDRDYPSEAMNRRQEGTAQFFLMIDQTGKVAACHVLKASGIPALDGMGCSVIQERAKFSPAMDSKGKPVRSTYITPPVSWRIAS
ncbi:MAG TPA: energy transducer TonB [Sphingomicrobium sp.]